MHEEDKSIENYRLFNQQEENNKKQNNNLNIVQLGTISIFAFASE